MRVRACVLIDWVQLSMALYDRILNVDPVKKQVTVQAGARVSDVLESLRPYGLTLQNLASINDQQIGGFIQVQPSSLPPFLPSHTNTHSLTFEFAF